MLSLVTSAQGAFKTVMAAGAVTLTLAGATLGTTEPAQAFVHPGSGGHGGGFHGGGFHGGGFRHGGFGHHFGGFGHRFGGDRFAHRGYGFRPYGFGVRRFAYRVGVPYGGYGFRRCVVGFRFVPGVGCLRVGYGHYGAVRPLGYRVIRVVHPYGYGLHRFGFGPHRFGYGPGRHFGGYGFHHPHFGGHAHGGHPHFGGHAHGGHGFGGHGFRRH